MPVSWRSVSGHDPDVVELYSAFTLGGVFLGITDGMERAVAADLLPAEIRATGFGVLAAVDGAGDFVSSAMVGVLWVSIVPSAGFLYSAALSIAACAVMLGVHSRKQNV